MCEKSVVFPRILNSWAVGGLMMGSVNCTSISVRVFSCMLYKCSRIFHHEVFKYDGSVSDSTDCTGFFRSS